MNDRDPIDEMISRVVRSIGHEVPPGLKARVRAAANDEAEEKASSQGVHILPLLAGGLAAAAVLYLLFFLPGVPTHKPLMIAEIRTEFEIPDKNIKIIFIQRPEFKFPKEVSR
jgi:hypothetical protein